MISNLEKKGPEKGDKDVSNSPVFIVGGLFVL